MERADDLERRLRDRLFKVAARGGDRAADGDRGDFAVSQPDLARALIERGDDGFEVGREGFLAGDLLQSAAHLAHGLRPAAGR